MNEEERRAAFVQGGGEREASEVFNELMKASVRAALWENEQRGEKPLRKEV